MIGAQITDGRGSSSRAKVSSIGELVTADFAYWETKNNLMDVVDTAYHFFPPKAGKQFIITGIILRANKLVSAVSDATVDIYEATSTTSTTISKSLFQTQIVESQIMEVMPIRIKVTEGFYINGKTDDDDISVNMFGFYVPRLDVT